MRGFVGGGKEVIGSGSFELSRFYDILLLFVMELGYGRDDSEEHDPDGRIGRRRIPLSDRYMIQHMQSCL